MPHYSDGTKAEAGDLVYGIPYNTQGQAVVGTLVKITSQSDTCNMQIAFVKEVDISKMYGGVLPASYVTAEYDSTKGTADGHKFYQAVVDYAGIKDFILVHRNVSN